MMKAIVTQLNGVTPEAPDPWAAHGGKRPPSQSKRAIYSRERAR